MLNGPRGRRPTPTATASPGTASPKSARAAAARARADDTDPAAPTHCVSSAADKSATRGRRGWVRSAVYVTRSAKAQRRCRTVDAEPSTVDKYRRTAASSSTTSG